MCNVVIVFGLYITVRLPYFFLLENHYLQCFQNASLPAGPRPLYLSRGFKAVTILRNLF